MAMAWPCLTSLLLPALLVSVAANKPPSFTSNMTVVRIPEDITVGKTVFWMTVTDPSQSPLTFSISGGNSSYFKVTPNTGQVTLAAPLDYETLPHFTITITVSYSQYTVPKQMSVIVEDRNDNEPIFENTEFSISINETEEPGSKIYQAKAKDYDTGPAGSVSYSINGFIPNNMETRNLFAIDSNGFITLEDKLSYNNKSSSYQLQLGACDLGGEFQGKKDFVQCSRPFYLSITVIDMPDLDPEFLKQFYSASVSEDAVKGTSVLEVVAVDGDKGLNWKMNYSITDSTKHGWFTIDPSSGVIQVSGMLDREELLKENEEVLVQVTATEVELNIYKEEAKKSTWVTLTVTDVNDNDPKFFNCSILNCNFTSQEQQTAFSGSVDEHASTRIPIEGLTMTVYDPDKDQNGNFNLSLVGPSATAFSVSPVRAAGSAEVQILVKNSSQVDFEDNPCMTVTVVATDTKSGNTSEAQVTIQLIDINDHRPIFPESLYNCTVQENCKENVVCKNITAYDRDQGSWGVITYSLLPGSGTDNFEVDAKSGKLTAKNCSLLDREKQAVYYLTLQASDAGNLASTTNLQIFLEDINDNPPRVSGSYNSFVQEGKDSQVSECLKVTDDDEPETNNSRLQFRLESSDYSQNFSVSASGCVSNLQPLDREAIKPGLEGRITLKVNVSDCGDPVLSTLAEVTITVEDINDNAPIFNSSSYDFWVKERVSVPEGIVLYPGVEVGVVVASDLDQTIANNRISFSLAGSGSNNFILRADSSEQTLGTAKGILWLPSDVSLDYETQKSYNFNVTAENPTPGCDSTPASIVVHVQDVNDEPPVLVATSLQPVFVTENGTQHGQVALVMATDPDTTAHLEIQLVNTLCTKDGKDVGSLCNSWFSVLPEGPVVISQSEAIDYEVCDQVTLTVRAHDTNTEGNFPAFSDNGRLSITIEDVNDNAPYFLPNDKTFVIIPELVIPNQQVAFVQARDNDSEKHGTIQFSIVKMEFVPKEGPTTPFQGFQVITSSKARVFTGSIELMTSLDSKLQGTYEVTVRAQDSPSLDSALQTQTTLNLFTVDQSYRITLEFSSSKEEVGTNVEKIKEALAQATRTSVYIVSIQDKESTVRAQGRTYLDAYFVFSNGTALKLDQLSVMIRGDQNSLTELLQLGLVVLGAEDKQNSDLTQRLSGVIIGLGVALALLIAIMTTALVCVRKSYKRELRAVKAAKEARQTTTGVTSSSSAIPGTNIYNSDRANPMLNLATKDLGFESQSSGSDMDRTSLNSLDENSVDLGKEKERKEKKKQTPQSQQAEDQVSLHSQSEGSRGLLDIVLSGRKESTSGQEVAFSNPGFDTTEDSTI